MGNVYRVINERIVVNISESTTGVQPFYVVNGDWYGHLDFDNNILWAVNYPDRKIEVESVRKAIKGEFAPYY